MSLMVWKSLAKEEKKLLSQILYMPTFSQEVKFEKRNIFLKYIESMTLAGKLNQSDLEVVNSVFDKWDKLSTRNAKEFVMGGFITEEQVDILFKLWRNFERCINNLKS